MQAQAPIAQAKFMTKAFSGVTVLHNVDFDIYPGEVHGLVGENGAGKSTLVKLIGGVFTPTRGEIYVEGRKVSIPNPLAARELGIVLMHQEPLTFPDLDVTENLFAGHTRDGRPLISWKEKRSEARRLLDSLELDIDELSMVRGMSIADQQMVEIICALSTNAKIIIMDEPTSALTLNEVNTLFGIIGKLKKQGKAIVFIGHRLEEIRTVADRITVLRDGEKVWTRPTAETTYEMMVQSMIGRKLSQRVKKEDASSGQTCLKVENLTLAGKFRDISIEVCAGEVVGMAGLVGAGRTELASAIFGITPAERGRIFIDGKEAKIASPREAVRKGIAMVPEDRTLSGLFMPFTVEHNMTFASLDQISRAGWLNFKKEDRIVDRYVADLSIRLRDTAQEARELSGGNQQKVVLSKWLMTEPRILLLDEPTRGIDVGAKTEVYKLIESLAEQGKAILLISSEMPEIILLCDRVYVMCEGRLTAVLGREELTEERIMAAASATLKKEAQKEAHTI